MEAWLVSHPGAIAEDLIVVAKEYDAFDQTSERLDILAALATDEGTVKLAVIELKRSGSSTTLDLQAIKYAAFVSTLDWDGVVAAHASHAGLSHGAADSALRTALELADGDEPLVDDRPRIILVAPAFRAEVTATVLWLIDEYGLDIECVQMTAHTVGSETVLSTQTLLPLPTAEDFRIRRQQKKASSIAATESAKKLEWSRVEEVVLAIPAGHWMSYQDVAIAAGGSPMAGMAVGQYLAKKTDEELPTVHRVLKRKGTVSPGFKGTIGGPDEVRALLESEGLEFDEKGRADQSKRLRPQTPGVTLPPLAGGSD